MIRVSLSSATYLFVSKQLEQVFNQCEGAKNINNKATVCARPLFPLMIQRRNLYLVNTSDKCQGVITRRRKTVSGVEESVLDYVIVSQDMVPFISEMKIVV